MSGVSIIEYKGKEIIRLDYRGLVEDQIIDCLKKAEEILTKFQRPKLNLTIFCGAYATKRVMDQAMILAKRTKHYSEKGAIVGVDGSKKIILEAFNKTLYNKGLVPFDSEQAALEYLIK